MTPPPGSHHPVRDDGTGSRGVARLNAVLVVAVLAAALGMPLIVLMSQWLAGHPW